MRKLIKSILCCLLCVLMVNINVFAATPATPTMNMKWYGDYTNNKLVISFTTQANYHQQVTVAMYPSNIVNPVFSDYVRTVEIYVPAGSGEKTVEFPITNTLNAPNGEYKVRIQGNGYMADICNETQTITIKTPSVAMGDLDRINAATTSSAMKDAISAVKDALQVEIPADPTFCTKLMDALINARTAEHNNAFTTLDMVKEAYIKSDIIVYLKESYATATGLRGKVEAQAELLDLDIGDVDYVAKASEIYDKVFAVRTTYNNTGIGNCATLVEAIKKYWALIMINGATVDELDDVVEKYINVLGLESDVLSRYNSFSVTSKEKAVRQLYSQGYVNPQEIATAFKTAVNTVYEQIGSGQAGGLGGGAGDSSFDKGNTNGNDTVTPSVIPTPSTTEFVDVATSHWAYSYITKLYSLNYISGYTDGTFLPDKNVTRDEFVKMIISAANLYDENAECDFSDVNENDWAYKYVASASQNGIVNGLSDSVFGKSTNITREDVAVIVARIITKLGKEPEGKVNPTLFSDEDKISDYAKDSIHLLERLNIVNGFEDNSYQPKELLTRAQAAKIISLLLETIG